MDVEKELNEILKTELKYYWLLEPTGYNKDNNLYHFGNGILLEKEVWDKYQKQLKKNKDLTTKEFLTEWLKSLGN